MPRLAASQSFGEDEIKALDLIVRGLMRGGDISRATSLTGFAGLCRKAQTMRKSIEAQKAKEQR